MEFVVNGQELEPHPLLGGTRFLCAKPKVGLANTPKRHSHVSYQSFERSSLRVLIQIIELG